MNNLATLLASLVLVLPAGIGGGDASPRADVARSAPEEIGTTVAAPAAGEPKIAALLQRFKSDKRDQVRIEQRVVIRIAPTRVARQDLRAMLPEGSDTAHFREQPMKRCVTMANVAGVQSGSHNRLILFMRDRRLVSAALERTCSARDFYSGFYVERTEDGLFCSGRDMLKSRTGATCGISRFANMVAVAD